MANNSNDDIMAAKRALMESIGDNELTLGRAVRSMRKITGMSQRAYAEHIVGIAPRILAEIELDRGNPTVETLNKIGRPFGFTVGFVPKTKRQ
jgi:DNA-binding XRE family transcriptional regulator